MKHDTAQAEFLFRWQYRVTPGPKTIYGGIICNNLRIARVIELPRGNALSTGVSGSGKQSLAKLAAFRKSSPDTARFVHYWYMDWETKHAAKTAKD
jgi:hypothetical protein